MVSVDSDLARLREPAPPPTFARTVMARVSRVADERAPALLAAPARDARREPVRRWNDLAAALSVFAGLVVAYVSWIGGRLEVRSWLDLLSPDAPLNAMGAHSEDLALLALALGLLIFAAGLLAPLRERPR